MDDVMQSILSIAKTKAVDMVLNNPQQAISFLAELGTKNTTLRTFLKSADWSPKSFSETIYNVASEAMKAFKAREHFSAVESERQEKFCTEFASILRSGVIKEDIDAKILAAGRSGYNALEVINMFGLKDHYNVETMHARANQLNEAYEKALKGAEVGTIGNSTEKPVISDLNALADAVKKQLSDGTKPNEQQNNNK